LKNDEQQAISVITRLVPVYKEWGMGKSRQSTSASSFARLRRFATDEAYQRVPRADRMPRSLSAPVIASSVVAPVLRIASTIVSFPCPIADPKPGVTELLCALHFHFQAR
jgi:hypothetical protein